MTNDKDLKLNNDDDLLISNGDLTIDESYIQECGIIIRLNQGDLKSDPLLGPGLVRMINGKFSQQEMQTILKVHLERDGKRYDDVKQYITTKTNG